MRSKPDNSVATRVYFAQAQQLILEIPLRAPTGQATVQIVRLKGLMVDYDIGFLPLNISRQWLKTWEATNKLTIVRVLVDHIRESASIGLAGPSIDRLLRISSQERFSASALGINPDELERLIKLNREMLALKYVSDIRALAPRGHLSLQIDWLARTADQLDQAITDFGIDHNELSRLKKIDALQKLKNRAIKLRRQLAKHGENLPTDEPYDFRDQPLSEEADGLNRHISELMKSLQIRRCRERISFAMSSGFCSLMMAEHSYSFGKMREFNIQPKELHPSRDLLGELATFTIRHRGIEMISMLRWYLKNRNTSMIGPEAKLLSVFMAKHQLTAADLSIAEEELNELLAPSESDTTVEGE